MRDKHPGSDTILADWQIPWAFGIIVAAAVASAGLVLFLTRRFTWYWDEWTIITGLPQWTVRDYFLPHNEHWSTIPYLVYDLLLHTVGLRSYIPYMAVLVVLLAANGCLLFVLLRPRTGSAVALAASLILLFLGRGYNDIYWAWQIGFVGSCTFGLAALVVIDATEAGIRRMAACSAFLILALMCSGIGLLFLAAVAISLVVRRDRWRHLPVIIAPTLVYMVWYAVFGRHGINQQASPYTLHAVAALRQYVPAGLGAAIAALFGVSSVWAPLALAVGVAGAAVDWVLHRRVDRLVMAAAIAVVLQFSLIGLTRDYLGPAEASSSRYLYIAAVFLLIVLADIVSHIPTPTSFRPVFALIFLCILAYNVDQMHSGRNQEWALVSNEDAQLQTIWAMRDTPGFQPQAGSGIPGITAAMYDDSRRTLGSPDPTLTPDQLATLPAADVNSSLDSVFPVHVQRSGLADFPKAANCQTPDATNGITFTVSDPDQRVAFSSPYPTAVQIYLWHLGAQPPTPVASVFIHPGQQFTVPVPDAGNGFVWHLRLVTQPDSQLTACAI